MPNEVRERGRELPALVQHGGGCSNHRWTVVSCFSSGGQVGSCLGLDTTPFPPGLFNRACAMDSRWQTPQRDVASLRIALHQPGELVCDFDGPDRRRARYDRHVAGLTMYNRRCKALSVVGCGLDESDDAGRGLFASWVQAALTSQRESTFGRQMVCGYVRRRYSWQKSVQGDERT